MLLHLAFHHFLVSFLSFFSYSFCLFNISAFPSPPPGSVIDIFILHLKYLNSSVLVPSQETNGSHSSTRASQSGPVIQRSPPPFLFGAFSHSRGLRGFCKCEHDQSFVLKEPMFKFWLVLVKILKAIYFFSWKVNSFAHLCKHWDLFIVFSCLSILIGIIHWIILFLAHVWPLSILRGLDNFLVLQSSDIVKVIFQYWFFWWMLWVVIN